MVDKITNGNVSDTNRWNRLSVPKLTYAEMLNLPSDVRQKGFVFFERTNKELLCNIGTSSSLKFENVFEKVGSMEEYAGREDALNDHWMVCNGRSLSKFYYSLLYERIGGDYGESGSSFNIPNYVGKFPVGKTNSGETGGENKVTLTTLQIPSHRHSYDKHTEDTVASNNRHGGNTDNGSSDEVVNKATNYTEYTGGSEAHENRPPYLKLHMIIKVR